MPSRKPLLLGEMPSAAGDRYHMVPLSGAPAARLSIWAGLEREGEEAWYWTLTRHFETMNAQERHGPWSLPAAQARWTKFLFRRDNPTDLLTVVCLGRRPEATIGSSSEKPWGWWEQVGALSYVSIPHPSGRNRLYNDKGMKLLAQRVLRESLDIAAGRAAVANTGGRVLGLVR